MRIFRSDIEAVENSKKYILDEKTMRNNFDRHQKNI